MTPYTHIQHINNTKAQFIVSLKYHDNDASKWISVKSQLDTGASCSAMLIADLRNIVQGDNPSFKLQPSSGSIKLYNGSLMKQLGRCKLKITGEDMVGTLSDIIDKLPWPISDGETCTRFGWISRNEVKRVNILTKEHIFTEYTDVFDGIGCLDGEYHIDIDPSVGPVQHASRRVPVPIKEKLMEIIKSMEERGIINVTTPTDWIRSLVAVKRPNKVRVCIDPKDLNKSIKRPRYPMPTIEEILPKLTNAKVFTVLDAKDGFFQIKLDEKRSYLTTFWTPDGRYRYLRMRQEISSAPKVYQRRQIEILDGLQGVGVNADDIFSYGGGDTVGEALEDHDRKLTALFKRLRVSNLKLNKHKLELRLPEVTYMRHILSRDGLKADPDKVFAIS